MSDYFIKIEIQMLLEIIIMFGEMFQLKLACPRRRLALIHQR